MGNINEYADSPLEMVNHSKEINSQLTDTKYCLEGALNHQLSATYLEDISTKLNDFHIFMKLISLAGIDLSKRMVVSLEKLQNEDISASELFESRDFESDTTRKNYELLLITTSENIREIHKKMELFFNDENINLLLDSQNLQENDKLDFLNKVIPILESWLKFNQDILVDQTTVSTLKRADDSFSKAVKDGDLSEQGFMKWKNSDMKGDVNRELQNQLKMLKNLYNARKTLLKN